MARLPQPGNDKGTWGEILNEFLTVEHNGDGTLKADGSLGDKAPVNNPVLTGSVTVPVPTLSTDAASKQYVDDQVVAGTPDADATTKGKVQLAGDLAGTAINPTVPGLAIKAPINNPTFTGNVTVPTPTNSTDAVTKAYADTAVDALPELIEGPGVSLTDLGGGVTQVATDSVNVQEFTVSGTWTKPVGAKMVFVYAWGAGGGGGGGRCGAASSQRCGGGGGAAGHYSHGSFPAVLLGATEEITVGTGGAGGTAAVSGSVDGGAGGTGGVSKFGAGIIGKVCAAGAGGGGGGTSAVAAAGGVGGGGIFRAYTSATFVGAAGASGAGTSVATSFPFGNPSPHSGAGTGGGGAAINTSNVVVDGSSGVGAANVLGGVYTAGLVGTAGATPSVILFGATGNTGGGAGGGGGGVSSNQGLAGGAGSTPSGGGGGGAGGTDGSGGAGSGAAGGNGFIRVVTIL